MKTNAEIFLKEGVSVEEYCKAIDNYVKGNGYSGRMSEEFLNAPVTPILTEDERVILRNIDTRQYPTIKRTKIGEIIVISNAKCGDDIICYLYCYDHLFQFIKNGEEYNIEELLK